MNEDFDDQLRDPYQYDNNGEGPPVSVALQLRSLSKRAWAIILYIGALCAWLAISDWVIAIAFLSALGLASVPLLLWWRRYSSACPLDLLIRAFGLGFILMFWSVSFVLLLAILPVEAFLFRKTPLLYLLTVNASMVGVEELHRAVLARWSKRDISMGRETKAHQLSYSATSVGYAAAATLSWLTAINYLLDSALEVKHDSLLDLGVAAMAVLCVILFGIPLHVLSGYLVGLETTRQTPLLKAPIYPFVYRTLFMYQILFWCVVLLQGADGIPKVARWLTFLAGMVITNVGVCMAMLRRIKRVEASFPIEYLTRVGYLNAFGYGVLPDADGDGGALEIPSTINSVV